MKTKSKSKSEKSKGIIGITLAAIMIASIFAVIAPTTVAKYIPPGTEVNSSIRIYGDLWWQGNAPERYDDWRQPFDPTVIPKDSITFNPAALDRDFGVVVNGENAREKIFLRAWYEPCGKYWGCYDDDFDSEYWGFRKVHTYQTINMEYTYMLMDTTWMPTHGGVSSQIAFPTCEIDSQTGLGAFDCAPQKAIHANLTHIAGVSGDVEPYGKTVEGWIELEKGFSLSPGDNVQFLDHKLEVISRTTAGDYVVKVWYAGNSEDDAGKGWILLSPGDRVYFDRHNNEYDTPNHDPAAGQIRTWYAELRGGNIYLGKELQNCDVFYVDAVRYDVTAIEVLDTTGDEEANEFKYITLRTKLPKCIETGVSPVMEESVVSSQWIDCIAPAEIIPVLPPFNEEHIMIDDIDIPLWKAKEHTDQWPYGNPAGTKCKDYLSDSEIAKTTNFPFAEKYLTMQNSSDRCFQRWLDYFDNTDASHKDMKIDTNDNGKWIAYDVSERVIEDVDATEVFYIAEDIEQRYSTDLLEKLNETWDGEHVYESWTKFDILSLPDMYTEFVLPELPDYYTIPDVDWQVDLDGDYLITTSLIAPTATGDLWDNKKDGYPTEQRVAFSYDQVNGSDGIDLYVNYNKSNDVNTVRIYGHGNASAPDPYTHWEQPFNPTVIRKDSITFDAAILRYSPEYSMHAQGENCDLKEYFRAWYVPEFEFFGEHCLGDVQPAIVTETTYMLIDSQDKKPWHADANRSWFAFPIVANLSTPQIGLDTFENKGVESAMENLVMLERVGCNERDLDELYKTTNGTIRIEKTYIMEPGQTVQFIDHKLKFEGYDFIGLNPLVDVWYSGNKGDREPSLANNMTLANTTRFFDRHNGPQPNGAVTARHPDRTWYAQFNEPALMDGRVRITVGKELRTGDIFYVDGVRYEIPAIEVLDWDGNLTNGCEKFKYITLRTPFPKYLGGEPEKIDECKTTSQYIVKIPECNSIPVLPPLNMEHEIVDDTDVVLWQPLQHLHKWPYGDPRDPTNYFRFGERYLTMQHPSLDIDSPSDIEGIAKWVAWAWYFRVIPIDTDDDIIGYGICEDWAIPKDPEFWDSEIAYAAWMLIFLTTDELQEHWIANDVDERIIGPVEPLEFCWKSEDVEPRYSTNLLEILNETLYRDKVADEDWTKYDIQTLPDEYTEFKLPEIPSLNPVCYVGGDYQDDFEPDIRAYPGSYLITTSFFAPNAKGNLNEEQEYDVRDRFAFTYNARDGTGIYMNEDPVIPVAPEGDRFDLRLHEGDNYVSLPVLPPVDKRSPAEVFGPDVSVWAYNAVSDIWERPTEVAIGTGYYVYAPKPKVVNLYGTGEVLTWPDIETTLQTGWNLVGPGNESIPMMDVTGVTVMKYDRGTFVLVPPAMGEALEPGEGYWIYK